MGNYQSWIDQHYPDKASSLNKCNEAVRFMVMRFPELTVQVGHANGVFHCWVKDPEGNIIDPTAKQFDEPIHYSLIAARFLEIGEIEPATGAIFLKPSLDF